VSEQGKKKEKRRAKGRLIPPLEPYRKRKKRRKKALSSVENRCDLLSISRISRIL